MGYADLHPCIMIYLFHITTEFNYEHHAELLEMLTFITDAVYIPCGFVEGFYDTLFMHQIQDCVCKIGLDLSHQIGRKDLLYQLKEAFSFFLSFRIYVAWNTGEKILVLFCDCLANHTCYA